MRIHSFGLALSVVISSIVLFCQATYPRQSDAQEADVPGDLARGQAIFEGKGRCLVCHYVANHGSLLGPDLSEIGAQMTPVQLENALLDPAPEVQPQNRLYSVVTREGANFTGKLLNQDRFSLQMLDSKEQLIAFEKSDLLQYHFVKTPPMPPYRDRLNSKELADLIAFLGSLQGVKQQ